MSYSLVTSYAGESLLSGFNWFDGDDPSHGFVSYQKRNAARDMGLYSIDEYTGAVRLGVDSRNTYSVGDRGRPSIRLESQQAFNHGLFIADFLHMPPSQCGLWPAFWAFGAPWPNGGEIDIIEGVSTSYENTMSAHTASGCFQSSSLQGMFSGEVRTTDCFVGTDNIGCGFNPPMYDQYSYGTGFNNVGGGVYAMLWDSEHIRVWHFPRDRIPVDIERKKPQPRYWGLPQAIWGGPSCDVDRYFKNMNIILNINFCGDYGNAVWGRADRCHVDHGNSCAEYVAKNPRDFSQAYWDVRYIDVYTESEYNAGPQYPPYRPGNPFRPGGGRRPEGAPDEGGKEGGQVQGQGQGENRPGDAKEPAKGEDGPSNESSRPPKEAQETSRPEDGRPNNANGRPQGGQGDAAGQRPEEEKGRSSIIGSGPDGSITKASGESTSTTTVVLRATETVTYLPNEDRVVPSPDQELETPARIAKYRHLGCFGSSDGFPSFSPAKDSDDMTLEKCVEICDNKQYTATFRGTCYCATVMGESSVPAESELCNIRCTGNSNEACGGVVPMQAEDEESDKEASDAKSRPKREILERIPDNVLLTVYGTADNGEPKNRHPQPPALGDDQDRRPATATVNNHMHPWGHRRKHGKHQKGSHHQDRKQRVTTSIKYQTVRPGQKFQIEEAVHTYVIEDCDVEEGATPTCTFDVPMKTEVVECEACGAEGESAVTLTVPAALPSVVSQGGDPAKLPMQPPARLVKPEGDTLLETFDPDEESETGAKAGHQDQLAGSKAEDVGNAPVGSNAEGEQRARQGFSPPNNGTGVVVTAGSPASISVAGLAAVLGLVWFLVAL